MGYSIGKPPEVRGDLPQTLHSLHGRPLPAKQRQHPVASYTVIVTNPINPGLCAALALPPGLGPAARRYYAGMYSVHKLGYDLETIRAVAVGQAS